MNGNMQNFKWSREDFNCFSTFFVATFFHTGKIICKPFHINIFRERRFSVHIQLFVKIVNPFTDSNKTLQDRCYSVKKENFRQLKISRLSRHDCKAQCCAGGHGLLPHVGHKHGWGLQFTAQGKSGKNALCVKGNRLKRHQHLWVSPTLVSR